MVFGPSGNGKTHLLSEFLRSLEGEIIVPHALYVYGQVLRIFDQAFTYAGTQSPPLKQTEPGKLRPKKTFTTVAGYGYSGRGCSSAAS
jgi:hypothetical protein